MQNPKVRMDEPHVTIGLNFLKNLKGYPRYFISEPNAQEA